ncbi:gluconate 2-dehydrogenase subunit 3 family protein [Thalassotalea maritima]|uniref:gluconate 2-dehydrogenase subunit 3 family protein n=1 Tax=Thalassotalea maritima TaxID=3242416 RepID=UPI0035293EC9
MNSFFDDNYQPPKSIVARISRRQFLKAAAVTSAITALPASTLAKAANVDFNVEPWATLDHVMQHLLPSSETGPGAKDFAAINYLYLLITEQPIAEDEKQFIKNGVGWLNGYTEKNMSAKFIHLTTAQKEQALKQISRSRAGENWISTLLSYLFEAMLAPSAYGGNPNGIGWQWLNHQAGFPMPSKDKRYWQLPAYGQINVKQG